MKRKSGRCDQAGKCTFKTQKRIVQGRRKMEQILKTAKTLSDREQKSKWHYPGKERRNRIRTDPSGLIK